MVWLAAELEWCTLVDQRLAFHTNVFSGGTCLLSGIAIVAQCPTGILHESLIGQRFGAEFAAEAVWVP